MVVGLSLKLYLTASFHTHAPTPTRSTSCSHRGLTVSPDAAKLLPVTITFLNIALVKEPTGDSVRTFQGAINSLPNLQHLILRGGACADLDLISNSLEVVDLSQVGKQLFVKKIQCPRLRKLTVQCLVRRIGQQTTDLLVGDVLYSELDVFEVACRFRLYAAIESKPVDVVALSPGCIISNEADSQWG